MVGVAAISGRVVIVSIDRRDAAKAWLWMAYFVVASFMAAWYFRRLM